MATQPTRFSLAAATKVRRLDAVESASPARSKLPRVSELTFESRQRAENPNRRSPDSAPVILAIYKVTDRACDLWNEVEDDQAALYQVQVKHDARPSVVFDTIRSFNEFLKQAHERDDSTPATLGELQKAAGIKLVVTDATDEESVGFIQWRVAFYVAGRPDLAALKNFLLLLDEFWSFKSQAMARDFEVHVYPHVGLDVSDMEDQFTYEHYSLKEQLATLPMGRFEAQPVIGRKIVTLQIQPQSGCVMDILINGNTYNFRNRLDACGAMGGYYETDEKRIYFRALRGINVEDEIQQQRVLKILGEDVFNNLAVRILVDGEGLEDERNTSFIEKLKALPQCDFK